MQHSHVPTFALIPLRRYSRLLRAPKAFANTEAGRNGSPSSISMLRRIDPCIGALLCGIRRAIDWWVAKTLVSYVAQLTVDRAIRYLAFHHSYCTFKHLPGL